MKGKYIYLYILNGKEVKCEDTVKTEKILC